MNFYKNTCLDYDRYCFMAQHMVYLAECLYTFEKKYIPQFEDIVSINVKD